MKETKKSIFYTQLTVDQQARVAVEAIDYSQGKGPIASDCQRCAACCYAFSIPGLKEAGEKCPNLTIDNGKFACAVYENRPKACKDFFCDNMPTNTPLQRNRVTQLFAARAKLEEIAIVEKKQLTLVAAK